MSTALPALRGASMVAAGGTRAQMRVREGNVGGYLTLARVDRKSRTALYALRIENDSPQELRALVQFARRHAIIDALPGHVDVAPFSIKESLLPVPLKETGPFDRAIVEVHGTDCRLSMEASAPARRSTTMYAFVACAVALLAIFGVALGAAVATPRILTFDVPRRAGDGPLDIPYVAAGAGTLHYEAAQADGTRVAAGILSERAGSITLRPYAGETVRLSMEGPFGSVQRTERIDRVTGTHRAASVRTQSHEQFAQALIGEFSITPSSPRAGDLVRVDVTTRAPQSELWLVDTNGTMWARKPVDVAGSTWLRIPANAGGRAMRLVVHATDGKAQTASEIGLVVLPRVMQNAPHRSGITHNVSALSFALAKPRAVSGEAVIAIVNGKHDDVHVSLTDGGGAVLAEGDISAGEEAISLVAPSVKEASRYFVVANVTSGTSTQSFVRPLDVVPALAP